LNLRTAVQREGFAQDFEADAVCAFPTRTLWCVERKGKSQTVKRLPKTARINCRFSQLSRSGENDSEQVTSWKTSTDKSNDEQTKSASLPTPTPPCD
jgi:hypothetical protein